ncbi:MAG: Nif3-like dinuclear metal center hexameric protein [Phaeovulum sp.]|uniref:Nif3-like dinuclear metal center hexameric protein n=1 Tax=Phaeovulum sp. TaxID=2934796 RepID=UPI002736FF12|nr:Nif3-like dinuclear metal center hexameric protein [Phaeovulum sp.]MDP3862176.1 Nif3-like dinuclear metal center hexameric protein [Phaeovulum sp.]
MNCKLISKHLEEWAPLGAAWNKDNVGLQAGKLEREIKNILLTLDITAEIVDEALTKNCNLIISHHPLLFFPIKKLNLDIDLRSQIIEKLIKHDITLLSYHTNLDFTKDGVSFQLAKRIGLTNIEFLSPSSTKRKKVVVYVPLNSVEVVAEALFKMGGGSIGDYSKCSNQINIKGTFLGSELSNPVIGQKGNFETVDEIRLEVIFDEWNINNAIKTIKEVHPYEEPAFEVYEIDNPNFQYGAGAIGLLKEELDENEFLLKITNDLSLSNLRFTKGSGKKIKKVAVCGGSGSDLLSTAINQKADAFITADVKYHTFQDAEGKICLIDAGHFETEVPVLQEVKNRIDYFLLSHQSNSKVLLSEKRTNPIEYLKTNKESLN